MMAIEVKAVSYTYPDGTPALQNVSLSIPAGSRTAILGPNGAGKSTLLLHLNGLLSPQRGQVFVAGRPVSGDQDTWVRETVGMVFQDPDDQVFSATVAEDVAFGPQNMGLPPEEVVRRVKASLAKVGLRGYEERAPHHLSYGEKKRVAIAGVLAMGPDILVLDEPMAYLDPQGRLRLRSILDELNAEGRTLLVATHDVDFAVEWADRIVVLQRGTVYRTGGPEILMDTDLLRATSLAMPTVARVFKGFERLCENRCPLTVEEARRLLASIQAKLEVE